MDQPNKPAGNKGARVNTALLGVTLLFVATAVLMLANPWGRYHARDPIPLVDPDLLSTQPSRQTYADLVREKEDLSDFDCYACHEKDKPPQLKFDDKHILIVPEEHSDIVMSHGSHNRNNLCYNCHNESNLTTLQTRDGQELKFEESVQLCGSCHGPTLRDWEAGAHGRTNGYWDRQAGAMNRLQCANCHNPHSPQIPSRKPAPGPNLLHATPAPSHPASPES